MSFGTNYVSFDEFIHFRQYKFWNILGETCPEPISPDLHWRNIWKEKNLTWNESNSRKEPWPLVFISRFPPARRALNSMPGSNLSDCNHSRSLSFGKSSENTFCEADSLWPWPPNLIFHCWVENVFAVSIRCQMANLKSIWFAFWLLHERLLPNERKPEPVQEIYS